MFRRSVVVSMAFLAVAAVGQEAPYVDGSKMVTGKVYACIVEGVRHYTTTPKEGGDCKVINYNFESLDVGPGWVEVSKNEDQVTYLNDKSIFRSGDLAGVWVMYHFINPQPASAGVGQHRSFVERINIQCKKQTIETLQRTFYSGAVGKGKAVGSWQPLSPTLPTYAIPNSVGAAIVRIGCVPYKNLIHD